MRALRIELTPFFKGVVKALSIEQGDEDLRDEQKEAVFDEIVHNAPVEIPSFLSFLGQPSNNLDYKFVDFLNLQ